MSEFKYAVTIEANSANAANLAIIDILSGQDAVTDWGRIPEAEAEERPAPYTGQADRPEHAGRIYKSATGFRLLTETAELRLTDEEAKGILLSALAYCGITRSKIDAETGAWLGGWAA